MSASNALETSLLQLLFNNTNNANVGDATGLRGSSTAGSFYVGLHTADPGEAGNQATSETAYTGYARIAVARSSGGWTITGNSAANAATILFGTCTASPGSALTYFSIGSDSTGAGNLFFSGALGASYQPALLNAPEFLAGQLAVTAD